MITDIVGRNFLSYKDEFHLHINQGQLNVVIGRSESDYADSNGTGKTSLLKALLWGLYGKFPGIESADSVVNTKAKKNTEVRVHFVKNGVNYVVQRYRKHREQKNNLLCWEGTHCHSGDIKVVQAKIEEIIGLDYDVFISTLVFTGEKEDAFASGTDKEQKQVLNALLPLAFERAFERATHNRDEQQRQVDHIQGEISRLQANIEVYKQQSQQAAANRDQWASNQRQKIQEAKQEAQQAEEAMKPHEEQLAGYKTNDEQWEKVFADLRTGKDDKLNRKQEITTSINALRNDLAEYERNQEQMITLRGEIEQAQVATLAEHQKVDEQIEALNTGTNQHCPTCGQVVQNDAMQRTLNTLAAQKQEIQSNHEAFVTSQRAVLETVERKQAEFVDPDKWSEQIQQLEAETREIETWLASQYAEETKYYNDYNTHKQQYEALRTTIESNKRTLAVAQQKLADLEAQTDNPYEGQVVESSKRLESAEKELESSRQTLQDATVGARRWDAVRTMFSGGKGGLHHFVFEQVLPEMTAMAQMFLNFFSANTLKVAFRSHKKKGKKTIEGFFVEAERKDVKGFGNLSRGEQRRVNVAISLTLYLMAAKHVFNPGILFLDEVADSLDQTGKQSIIELLEHFCTQYDTAAVLLTNERELIAHVHSGYECVMQNDESHLRPISES